MHGEGGRIGYSKMWGYKNELLLPYNPWFLVEKQLLQHFQFSVIYLLYILVIIKITFSMDKLKPIIICIYNYLCVLKYIPIL